jgi:hypothetical protein
MKTQKTISTSALKEALANAIGESIGTDGTEVEITVPSVQNALACLDAHFGGCDTKNRKPDRSYEVQGTEDGCLWSLLLKEKP